VSGTTAGFWTAHQCSGGFYTRKHAQLSARLRAANQRVSSVDTVNDRWAHVEVFFQLQNKPEIELSHGEK
jgi:hypothetical protein